MKWQIPDNLRNQKAAVVVIWPKENILQIAWSFLENIDNAEKTATHKDSTTQKSLQNIITEVKVVSTKSKFKKDRTSPNKGNQWSRIEIYYWPKHFYVVYDKDTKI